MFFKPLSVVVITMTFYLAQLSATPFEVSHQKFPYVSYGVKRIDDPSVLGELKLSNPKQEFFFDQILNHFDYNNNKTFKQVRQSKL